MSKTNKSSYKNDQYVKKLKKKNYYKKKCKECNENIKIILEKLTPKERGEIEKEIKINNDTSNNQIENSDNSSFSIEEKIGVS